MRKVRTDPELIELAAAAAVNEQQVAARAGLSVGALRCLLSVSVLRNTGMLCHTADVVGTALAGPTATRRYLHQLVQQRHLERIGGPVSGHIIITDEGRKLVAGFVRGWVRGRHQLRGLEPCRPWSRTTPKPKPKKPAPPTAPAEP